jgi:hypothetical protein
MIVDHPSNCHVLMRIPKRNFKFCTPDAWNGENTFAGCPKWDVNFLLVGNEAGFATISLADEKQLCSAMAHELRLLSREGSQSHAETLARHGDDRVTGFRSLARRPHSFAYPGTAHDAARALLTKKAFRKSNDEVPLMEPLPEPRAGGDVINIFAAANPLRADPHAMIYTDGSVIQVKQKELETATQGATGVRLADTTATVSGRASTFHASW